MHKQIITLQQNVMKKERQEALDIAMAEGEITQYLPLSQLSSDVDFLFQNVTTARCISNYIWAVLENSGMADPNLTQLTTTALKLCFSRLLRAHMYYARPDTVM